MEILLHTLPTLPLDTLNANLEEYKPRPHTSVQLALVGLLPNMTQLLKSGSWADSLTHTPTEGLATLGLAKPTP